VHLKKLFKQNEKKAFVVVKLIKISMTNNIQYQNKHNFFEDLNALQKFNEILKLHI